jgi:hypothetical protein
MIDRVYIFKGKVENTGDFLRGREIMNLMKLYY